ncbi:elongation factor P [Botrimarina hoheduenensis]|uniref:Elongation factor P n=1 Tax=Botrimarina hoheduenensis TaxID=2528000 RepID=A0A5C5W6H0_9BACT|nr:elongation factor P [Botrimarina hoheduenensis]TWT46486.1 Elongation factor P [Botrimarina hoheduenensis]
MGTISTSDFRKGMKVQIDGIPFLCTEMNFRKPGKGTALYECKLKNLIRNTVVDRTYRAGQTLEEADIMEFTAQYLYRQGEGFVFMNNQDYEQYELNAEQVGDVARFLKENMDCQVMTFNDLPIAVSAPNHVVLKVVQAEPAPKGNTATGVQKPVTLETGSDILAPAFINEGDWLRVDTRTGEYIERTNAPEGEV